jgi:hypothetical protein
MIEKKIDSYTEVEWKNCYKLYEAVYLYDLDTPLDFDTFKKKMKSDKSFRSIYRLGQDMDKKDYNPWLIKNISKIKNG